MKINEKEYKLDMTGLTLVLYKKEFNKDMFSSLMGLDEGIDIVSLLEITWAMAKTVDNSVPSFYEFAGSIRDLRQVLSRETIEEVSEIVSKTTKTEKKA